MKKERPKPEPSSKPKINVKEAYHGKNAGKPITLPKSAQRSKPVINSNTPYGPPPPPPKVNNVESKTISTKQVEQIKVIPAKSDSPKLDPIHKSPAPQKKVLLNQKPVELPKQTKENQLSTKQSVQTPTKPEQAPIDNRSVPAKGKALQGKVTKQPLKEARSDPAPKRPAEHKCVFKEESKAKEDDTSAKKKKFKKKKKRNESLGMFIKILFIIIFTIHYSLFIMHYSLFIIHYSSFIIHYSLFIIHYHIYCYLVTKHPRFCG